MNDDNNYRLTDRSRVLAYQKCPRLRWLEYEMDGTGVRLVHRNIPLATGFHSHVGFAIILCGGDVEDAVKAAVRGYEAEVAKYGLILRPEEDAHYVAYEQIALVEGLVRLFAARSYPDLLRQYEVVTVEEENVHTIAEPWRDGDDAAARLIAPGLRWMSRADALLVERESRDFYLYSIKTTVMWDKRRDSEAHHDMQGVSEAVGLEARLRELWETLHAPLSDDSLVAFDGREARLLAILRDLSEPPRIQGVKMEFLLKGRRDEYPEGSGRYVQWSPLIRAWRQQGVTPAYDQWAWAYEWRDEFGLRRRLAKGKGSTWERVDLWPPGQMGVKAWVERLASGAVQPEASDALDKQRVTPVPYFRQDWQMRDWQEQIVEQELVVAAKAVDMNQARVANQGDESLELRAQLNRSFPQHTRSCDWPTLCQMSEICWGPAGADPIGSGLYRKRDPHHDAEREAWEEQ